MDEVILEVKDHLRKTEGFIFILSFKEAMMKISFVHFSFIFQ